MSGSIQLRRYLFHRQARAEAAALVGMSIEEARLTGIARDKGELADVEPLDPATPPPGHNHPPKGPNMADNVAADELRLLIERIERLEEEKKAIGDDVKDVYAEGKARGYDTKTMRRIVALRKMEPHQRQEAAALLETYAAAVGMQFALL